MQAMVESIASPQVPVFSNNHPFRTGPSFENALAILVPPNTSVDTPEPPRRTIIVLTCPQMPVCTHTFPMALRVAPQNSQAITMHTNALIPAKGPLFASMQAMIETVSLPQVPILPDHKPTCTVPSLQNTLPVQVAGYTPELSPEPCAGSVIVIFLEKVPVRTNSTPLALVVAEKRTQPVAMHSNAFEPPPDPSSLFVQDMVEVIPTMKMPELPHYNPTSTGPAILDSQTVQVTTNASGTSPAPAVGLVVVVFLPQMPVRPHAAPFTLVVPEQSAQTVQMQANTSEITPSPTLLSM